MKAPSFSLKSLLLLVVAIALFLPQYPFLERGNVVAPLSGVFIYVDDWNRRPGVDGPFPKFQLFPPDVSVKRAVWQTAAAEVVAVAGWFLLKRLRARRPAKLGNSP